MQAHRIGVRPTESEESGGNAYNFASDRTSRLSSGTHKSVGSCRSFLDLLIADAKNTFFERRKKISF